MDIPNSRIEKIKASKEYQEHFAKEWSKCIVSPSMIPAKFTDLVIIHMKRVPFANINLKYEAWHTLRHKHPSTWDISQIQIGLSYALQVSEADSGMNALDYLECVAALVKLHDMITTMFLECEKKCINSVIFQKQLGV